MLENNKPAHPDNVQPLPAILRPGPDRSSFELAVLPAPKAVNTSLPSDEELKAHAEREHLMDTAAEIHGWKRPQWRAAVRHLTASGVSDFEIRFEDASPSRLLSIQRVFVTHQASRAVDPLTLADGATGPDTAWVNTLFNDAMFVALSFGHVDKRRSAPQPPKGDVPRGTN